MSALLDARGIGKTFAGIEALRDVALAVEAGERPLADRETLDEETRAFEAVALGLRRVDGFSREAFRAEFGDDPLDKYAEAVAEGTRSGLLEVDGDAMRLTPDGRLLASEVLVAFAPAARVR